MTRPAALAVALLAALILGSCNRSGEPDVRRQKLFDELGSSPDEDIYRAESTRLDARAELRFTDAWALFLSGRNLTDEPERTFRNGDERFIAKDPGYEIYGREYRFGVSLRR